MIQCKPDDHEWDDKDTYSVCTKCGEIDVWVIKSDPDMEIVLEGEEARKFHEQINNPDPERAALRKRILSNLSNKKKYDEYIGRA